MTSDATPTEQGGGGVPLVSVVIINYNKKDILRRCIDSALEISWPNLEVIVVDNHSSDGAPEMVESEYGDRVVLIRRDQSNATGGRNTGYRQARGSYVLSIDNDIVLPDKDVVARAIELFGHFPRAGALTFKIGPEEAPQQPLPEHWWYPVPLEQGKDRFFRTTVFSEGAVFFRPEVLRVTGGYDETYGHHEENVDLGLRMLEAGWEVVFCPTLVASELSVRGFHVTQRSDRNYLSLRNKLYTAWKHYPLPEALAYGAGRIGMALFRAVRFGWIDYWIKAVLHGAWPPREIRAARRPMGPRLRRRVAEIKRGELLEAPAA